MAVVLFMAKCVQESVSFPSLLKDFFTKMGSSVFPCVCCRDYSWEQVPSGVLTKKTMKLFKEVWPSLYVVLREWLTLKKSFSCGSNRTKLTL